MLRMDLSDVIRIVGKQRVHQVDEPPYVDEDVEYVSPIRGRVTITNSGRLLLVRGQVETTVSLECARCLSEFRQQLRATLDEQFSLSEVENAQYHDVAPAVVQDEENEVPSGLFDGTVINLAVLVRQAAILASPVRPLCREDCLGLCPRCGKNLNLGECRCSPAGTGRPLSAFGDFFNNDPPSRN